MTTLNLVVLIISIALVFDFINGFHDAANSIATIVATRVLTPLQAVAWAAVFNFVAAFTFGTAVADTVGQGFVDLDIVTPYVILAGVIGAIIWDLIRGGWVCRPALRMRSSGDTRAQPWRGRRSCMARAAVFAG
jgi:PiT family inorganic phosphate transporter